MATPYDVIISGSGAGSHGCSNIWPDTLPRDSVIEE